MSRQRFKEYHKLFLAISVSAAFLAGMLCGMLCAAQANMQLAAISLM